VSEIICEEVAHKAGFVVSVGNWIAPNGELIVGENYDEHHWETIIKYLGSEPETENNLQWMNDKVGEGFIRLVFRADVMFQVGCAEVNNIWSEQPNYITMISVLKRLNNIQGDIHVFSKSFYVIGKAEDIVEKNIDRLQIRVQK
jgi:hypothetical protein